MGLLKTISKGVSKVIKGVGRATGLDKVAKAVNRATGIDKATNKVIKGVSRATGLDKAVKAVDRATDLDKAAKGVKRATDGVDDFIFGKKDKTKTISAEDLVLDRSPEQEAFAKYFFDPVVFGINTDEFGSHPDFQRLYRMEKAREDLLNAYNDYGQKLQDRISSYQDYLPTINTPFGELPAYGLQRSMLKNEGVLASLMRESMIPSKQIAFDILYQQPIDLFMRQDLARLGVQGQPVVERGSPGLLGSLLGGAGTGLGMGIGMKLGGLFL